MSEWQDRIIETVEGDPADLVHMLHPDNPKGHPEAQMEGLEHSLNKVGWIDRPIWNRRTNYFLDGNGRVKLALATGQRSIKYDVVDLSPEEEKYVLATFDPLGGMAETDAVKLLALVKEVGEDLPGGVAEHLLGMVKEAGGQENGAGEPGPPPVDRAEELRVKWGVELGQLWVLGEHRLVCGDCTEKGVVDRVMGGDKLSMIYTDPPYDEIDKEWDTALDWHLISGIWKNYSLDNTHLVLCGKVRFLLEAHDGLKSEWVFRMEEIWRKPQSGSPGNKKRFLQVHENIWWFRRRNNSNLYFNIEAIKIPGDPYRRIRKSSTVVDYANKNYVMVNEDGSRWPLSVIECNQPRFSDESEAHPTQKPVKVISRGILGGTREGDLVYDPFLGSGTTLIACENLGRRCRAVEISPGYCAVALERWAQLTGGEPVLG